MADGTLAIIGGGGGAPGVGDAAAAAVAVALLRPASNVVLLSTVSIQAVMVKRATITSQGCEAQNSPWARNKRPIIFTANCNVLVQRSLVIILSNKLSSPGS